MVCVLDCVVYVIADGLSCEGGGFGRCGVMVCMGSGGAGVEWLRGEGSTVVVEACGMGGGSKVVVWVVCRDCGSKVVVWVV